VTASYPIDDTSRVAEVRRAVTAVAREEQLDETLVGNAALVITEICTNLLKHANRGEVFVSKLSERSEAGVEILAVDRGPGMANVERCLADGYSSGDSPGTGLGAIARASQEFDIYSDEPRGTVLVSRIRASKEQRSWLGAVLKPIQGEEVCGDAWDYVKQDDKISFVVADGLGHGALAARASSEAITAFRSGSEYSPVPALERIHTALRATRGAAVAIAHFDARTSTVRYAGIGNIAGALVKPGKVQMMVSHNGTAGYHSPRFQEFVHPLAERALLVMHSDGLHTNWNLEKYPGLRQRDPSVIAGVLYRDSARNKDDVCVVVANIGGAT
jgi:anti-sigma regulatory factor (Ser/Thr protein kinase)